MSCGIIQTELCKAVHGCECGPCADPIEEWMDCLVDRTPDFPQGCQVRCQEPAAPAEAADVSRLASSALPRSFGALAAAASTLPFLLFAV